MTNSRFVRFSVVLAALALAGSCAHKPEAYAERKKASAALEAKSGSSISGNASFDQYGDDVVLTIAILGATPGVHAVHIHQNPDCSDAEAKSAGDHWNPEHAMHGQFDKKPFHLGDVGNIEVGSNGAGELKLTTPKWSIDSKKETDILHHSVVVHASADDLKTDPSGNSGGRQACGVINLK